MNVFKKKGGLFVIDETILPKAANKTDIKNALYVAVYKEFLGAVENPKYKDLTSLERFNNLNNFATEWLQSKGFKNV